MVGRRDKSKRKWFCNGRLVRWVWSNIGLEIGYLTVLEGLESRRSADVWHSAADQCWQNRIQGDWLASRAINPSTCKILCYIQVLLLILSAANTQKMSNYSQNTIASFLS